MRRLSLALALLLAACGGEAKTEDATVVGHGAAPNDADGSVSGAGGTGVGGNGGAGGFSSAQDSGAPYHDPGCPTETQVPGYMECDVQQSLATCPTAYHCIPTVTYGEKCHTEEIGSRCVPVGTATQGEDCTSTECADGYVCVTGGTGLECAKLCYSQADCPAGLLCSALDVDGYGVCG